MFPSDSRLNAANGVFANAIIGCNFSLKSGVGANCNDLRFRQFCRSATFSSIRRAMFSAILLVALGRVPSQIFKAIIPRVPIIVATLQPIWPRTNKSSHHQRMRLKDFLFAVFVQIYKWTIHLFVARIRFQFSRFDGPYISAIRNFIKALKTNYRQPIFHVNPLMWHTGRIA